MVHEVGGRLASQKLSDDHEVGGRLALVRMVLPGGRPPTWCSLQNYCCYTVGVRLKKKKAFLAAEHSFTF